LGADLAAVDFICTKPDGEYRRLILMEVKDFRRYALQNKKRQTSGALVVEVITKCMHTVAALFLLPIVPKVVFPNFEGHPFGEKMQSGLKGFPKIELVFFMEEDAVRDDNVLALQNQKARVNDMALKLRRLKGLVGIQSKILSTESIATRDGFEVTSVF
jgi:hypothetical protein